MQAVSLIKVQDQGIVWGLHGRLQKMQKNDDCGCRTQRRDCRVHILLATCPLS